MQHPRLFRLATSAITLAIVSTVAQAKSYADEDPALAAMDRFVESTDINRENEKWRLAMPKPPKLEFSPGLNYYWVVATNMGEIKVQLLTDVAPMHASAVIFLSKTGYYDTLKFHRVIKGFMAQGGCPLGTGTGGPGFQMAGEISPSAKHDRAGVLSAANRGKGTPEGSQFFLTFGPTPHLDGIHTVYGRAVDGLDVLNEINAVGGRTNEGRTTQPVFIKSTSISVEGATVVDLPSSHDSDDPAIASIRRFIEAEKLDTSKPGWRNKLNLAPTPEFSKDKTYTWNILTNKGALKLRLSPDVAPAHVTSAIYLTMAGFYDKLTFHRVIKGFVAQGGCPLGTGKGRPYKLDAEVEAGLKFDRKGLLGAAKHGDKASGSQFFITLGPTPNLDELGGYTIFGELVDGLDVLDKLESAGARSRLGRPTEALDIVRATITIEPLR